MDNNILKKLHKEQIEILDFIVEILKKNKLEYVLVGGTLLGAVRHQGYIPWDDDLDIGMPRKDYEQFLNIAENELRDKYILDYHKKNKKYWIPFAKIRIKDTIYQEKLLKNYKTNHGIWVDIFPLDNAESENERGLVLRQLLILFLKKIALLKLQNYTKSRIKNLIKYIVNYVININVVVKIENYIMQLNKNDNSRYFVNFGSQYGIKKQTHLKEKYFPAKELEFEGKKYKVPNDYDYVLTKIYGKNYMQLPPIEKRITHNPIKIKFEDGEEIVFDEGEK